MMIKDKSKDKTDLQGDSLERWYENLKAENDVTANTWLVNMRMVHRLYGKSPTKIAKMKPEEAYNFVIDMIKSMQSDGRSFSYIDSMIKSIKDWLEFNGAKLTQEIKLPSESRQSVEIDSGTRLQQAEFGKQSSLGSEFALYKKDLLVLLKEKSESLLEANGTDFVNEMRHLETILTAFDPAPDSMIRSVDKMVNEGVEMDVGAYYLAAYSTTRELDISLKVYVLTNSLMRYIALMDSFYETGDNDSLQRANRLLEEVTFNSLGQMRYSIKLSIEKFWPFWMFEKMIKQRMLNGGAFSDKELRYFILFKSSDTPLLYCTILDSHLETFNPNVAMVFHYNQGLIDILDDYYDIEEDLRTRMPNIFILAASDNFQFSQLELDVENARRTIMGKETKDRIISLVDWLAGRLEEVALPSEYAYLRHITADHIHKLKSMIL
ncbi:MAG: hypothetical protein ACREBU_04320 [Nitrososphaera sp.]